MEVDGPALVLVLVGVGEGAVLVLVGVGEGAVLVLVGVGEGAGVEVVEVEESTTGIGSGSGPSVVVTTAVVFETVVDEQQPRDPNLTVPIPESASMISGDFVLSFFFSASTTCDGARLDAPRFVTLYCNEASVVPT
jgi:hypothetical protein